jgi:hypothetical protein
VLGRYDSVTGQLRMAGRSTRVDDHTAAQLAAVLQPAGPNHPWPEQLPATWGGRGPGPYTRVEPTAVVEIRADPATAAGRWRHKQRVHRFRAIDPREVPLDLDLD